jgi:hypothetical protein
MTAEVITGTVTASAAACPSTIPSRVAASVPAASSVSCETPKPLPVKSTFSVA